MFYKATSAYGIFDKLMRCQALQVHDRELKPDPVKDIADKARDALEGGTCAPNAKELVKSLREAMREKS